MATPPSTDERPTLAGLLCRVDDVPPSSQQFTPRLTNRTDNSLCSTAISSNIFLSYHISTSQPNKGQRSRDFKRLRFTYNVWGKVHPSFQGISFHGNQFSSSPDRERFRDKMFANITARKEKKIVSKHYGCSFFLEEEDKKTYGCSCPGRNGG